MIIEIVKCAELRRVCDISKTFCNDRVCFQFGI